MNWGNAEKGTKIESRAFENGTSGGFGFSFFLNTTLVGLLGWYSWFDLVIWSVGNCSVAERLSFLTEQIAFYTSPTVGGLLNATFGNVTEVIIALFALHEGKIMVVKCSLLGSILSNLLLVLGTSLFCGGLANLGTEQPYDRKQADVSTGLLILGVLCHSLPLMLRYVVSAGVHAVTSGDAVLELSRACSIVMLLAYGAYLYFQLKTHRQLFEPQEDTVASLIIDMLQCPHRIVVPLGGVDMLQWLILLFIEGTGHFCRSFVVQDKNTDIWILGHSSQI